MHLRVPARIGIEEEIRRLKGLGELTTDGPSTTPEITKGFNVSDALQTDLPASAPFDTRPNLVIVPEEAKVTIRRSRSSAKSQPSSITIEGTTPTVVKAAPSDVQTNVTGYGPQVIRTQHSTTLDQLLPLADVTHLADKPVLEGIANFLIRQLMRLNPKQDIHIVDLAGMAKVGGANAAGIYFSTPSDITAKGPLFLRDRVVGDKKAFTYVLLHEAAHLVTANALYHEPLKGRITDLMEAARKYLPKNALHEQSYGFTNEREFVAEAYLREEFQKLLREHDTPRDLVKKLGLERKLSLWEAFKHTVRDILGMPDTRETMTLLEATLRVGADIMDVQAKHIQDMQQKINPVEPELTAVERQEETRGVYDTLSGLKDYIPPEHSAELTRQAGYADKMNKFYKYMIYAFQLGELNPNLVPLQRYLEKMRFAAVEEFGD